MSAIDPEAQPILRGYAAAAEFCRETLGLNVITERFVRSEKHAGALPYYLVANKVCFSPRDVAEWIQSLRDRSRETTQPRR